MKPLPESAPLTDEDRHIRERFLRVPLRWPLWLRVLGIAGVQDRRDAALMFGYEDAKARYIASAGVFAYWEARRLGVDLARRAIR